MSQSNRSHPPFNFLVQEPVQQQYFNSRTLQTSNNISQQWTPSGSRSVQHNMPSPSTSVRSAVTAPVSRVSDRFHNNNVSPVSVDSRIDPNLLGLDLLVPPGINARNNYNPLDRYHEEAWNPYHLRNSNSSHDRTSPHQTNPSFKSFRPGPGSVGSAGPISDSGFYSQSVMSHDAGRVDQSVVSPNLTQRVNNLNVQSLPSDAPEMMQVPSDQRSQISHISSRSGRDDNQLRCPDCNEILKCKSDFKKHRLRHEKPFSCREPGCKRKEGFTTVNDLDRHRKSVHRIDLYKKSYQCASENCRNKEKIWPRLDNFKQHIERMHKDEDSIDLIKRSTFTYKPSVKQTVAIPENVSVAPIDTMIVGMEKSFSGQSNYESAVEPDLRSGQETTQWPINLNPADHPMSFHPAPTLPANSSLKMASDHKGNQRVQNGSRPQRQHQGGLVQHEAQKDSTGEIKNAALLGRHTGEQQKRQHAQVSDAPPTKAQQQREALKKLSQAASEDSSIPIDLEQLVMRLLKRTVDPDEGDSEASDNAQPSSSTRAGTDRTSKIFLTKGEAIKAAQMISNLIKQSPGSSYSQPRKSSQPLTANPKVCELCGYAVARVCDLKKHMKRHEKPYGCTYPKCHKRFGAKSDWKRHENSQHFQLEAFRCGQVSINGRICGDHFFRVERFTKHLETQHAMSGEQLNDEIKRRRIGKNCQHQFWCGFHKDIVVLKEKRNAAWDERFDHIAYHFEKEKKSIEDWVCVEENRTKRELLREMDRYVFDDEESSETIPPPPHQEPPPPPPTHFNPGNNKKREASTDLSSEKSKKSRSAYRTSTEEVYYCCSCRDGPKNISLHPSCLCGHNFCGICHTD